MEAFRQTDSPSVEEAFSQSDPNLVSTPRHPFNQGKNRWFISSPTSSKSTNANMSRLSAEISHPLA
jgi:hypothetical protein